MMMLLSFRLSVLILTLAFEFQINAFEFVIRVFGFENSSFNVDINASNFDINAFDSNGGFDLESNDFYSEISAFEVASNTFNFRINVSGASNPVYIVQGRMIGLIVNNGLEGTGKEAVIQCF
jgi:hypothetical protein